MSSVRSTVGTNVAGGTENVEKTMQVARLIRAFQGRGHELANLDPLGLMDRPTPDVLNLSFYGLAESESEVFHVGTAGAKLFPEAPDAPHTLSEIVARLKITYCQTIGYEYM